MKTIALFGGSGRTGQDFLQQALAQGHRVKALVRNLDKVSEASAQLTLIQGDVLNPADVLETVTNTDVVVSLFGHVKGSPAWLQTDGTRNIVRAMKEGRLIVLSHCRAVAYPTRKTSLNWPTKPFALL